ncbi:MAG TPA: tyrosine-type recombinase/integrase [Solirubrobacteraceae bacterium]|nr:tyrosine-type recombinase/integrase [Solirubrobacteraceae bacterium]
MLRPPPGAREGRGRRWAADEIGSARGASGPAGQERAAAGTRWGNRLGLVFTTVRGDPLIGAVVTRAFQRVLEGAGLRRMRFHDLRHSCDTFLQALGVPPRVVMDILGHSVMAMTRERYARALPEGRREAVARMDRLLGADDRAGDRSQDSSQPGAEAQETR